MLINKLQGSSCLLYVLFIFSSAHKKCPVPQEDKTALTRPFTLRMVISRFKKKKKIY